MILQEKTTKRQPLFSLTNRFILFLLGFTLIIFIFYVCAQTKGFLDSNLRLLLGISCVTSTILLVFLIFEFFYVIFNVIRFKAFFYFNYMILYIVTFLVALIICIVSVLLYFFT